MPIESGSCGKRNLVTAESTMVSDGGSRPIAIAARNEAA